LKRVFRELAPLHRVFAVDVVQHLRQAAVALAGEGQVVAPTAVADGKPEGEAERLVWAMERSGWVQAKAARLLKISPRQMGYALQKHGIEVRKF
jgi:Nif-specific regulatory protein